MSAKGDWQKVQKAIGNPEDGIPGKNDEAALTRLKEAALAEHRAPKPTDGVNRTDWRGFKEVSEFRLTDILPKHAWFLVPFFINSAREFNLNPLFLIAISKHETANWTSNVFRTKANAMGISSAKGAVSQESYNASIRTAAYSLSRPGGYYAKAKTLADVGAVYAPVGAKNDPTKLNGAWPTGVARYWSELEKAVA